MIANLTGILAAKDPSRLVLDVNGVGYEVFIPLSTYFALPDLRARLTLHVFTHLREDSIQLFGFLTPDEKTAFTLLTKISGVGGKLALSVLSALKVANLREAVLANDVGHTRVGAGHREKIRGPDRPGTQGYHRVSGGRTAGGKRDTGVE